MPSPMLGTGEWFVIREGEHAGRWHLAGWVLDAHLGAAGGSSDGWLRFAGCPRCHAMVPNRRAAAGSVGLEVFAHEDWHAATDFPHPEVTGG